MIRFKFNITGVKEATEGIDRAIKVMQSLKSHKLKLFALIMSEIGKQLILYSPNAASRAYVMRTFKNLGVDLSKYYADTTKIPQLKKALNKEEAAKGYRDFAVMTGNALKVAAKLSDPIKFHRDVLYGRSDKKSPFIVEINKILRGKR